MSSPTATNHTALTMALAYAAQGLHVHPVDPATKAPLTKHGHHDASIHPDTIRQWWRFWPDAGIGVALAASGLVDVAPDSPEALTDFEGRGLPTSAVFTSPGGEGHQHFLFRRPAGCPTTRICRSGEYDVMSGGYTILPNGDARRVWLTEAPNLNGSLPDAPAWAVQMLREHVARRTAPEPDGGTVGAGARNVTLTSYAGSLRRLGLGAEGIAAALHGINQTTCVPPLPDAEVERIAASVSRYAPSPTPAAGHGTPAHAPPGDGWQARALQAEAMLDQLRDLQSLTAQVRRHGCIKSVADTAVALAHEILSAESRAQADDGAYLVRVGRLGESAGYSPRTASRHLGKLAGWNLIERRYERGTRVDTETGEMVSYADLYVRLPDGAHGFLTALARFEPPTAPDPRSTSQRPRRHCPTCTCESGTDTLSPPDDPPSPDPEAGGLYTYPDNVSVPDSDAGRGNGRAPTPLHRTPASAYRQRRE